MENSRSTGVTVGRRKGSIFGADLHLTEPRGWNAWSILLAEALSGFLNCLLAKLACIWRNCPRCPLAVLSPRGLEQLERDAMKRVREECPNVEWLSSYAVLGPCDYLDVFVANDIETAARVSTIIRTFGHAQTEIWTATEWDRFKEIVRTLPGPG
jgi:uncharacterized protein with GYD domain